jgi:hypothetical protein
VAFAILIFRRARPLPVTYSYPLAEPDDLTRVHRIVQRLAIRTVIVNYPNSHLRLAETPDQATEDFEEMAAAGLNPVTVV